MRLEPIPLPYSLRKPYTTREIVSLTVYAFVFLSGTIGNGLVIKLFLTKVNIPGSRFVIVLAGVDLLASIWVPLYFISTLVFTFHDTLLHCPFGNVGCRVIKIWYSSMVYASAWLLVAICIERVRQCGCIILI